MSACEGLSASQAARAWTEVADQLEAMGDRAQKCLQQRRAWADEQLAIRKQHVASRLAIFNSAESES